MDLIDDSEAAPAALFRKRVPKKAPMRRKRIADSSPPPSSSSDSSSDGEGKGQRIKRQRKAGGILTSSAAGARAVDTSKSSKYAADRSAAIAPSEDATKQTDWYEEAQGAARNLSAKELLGSTSTSSTRPANGTTSATTSQSATAGPGRQAKGPVKAPTNIRSITITDYAPDVCKDYKQTGHCGFGDGCIFLHSREDYKAGWQLDREWETVTQGKKRLGGTVVSSRGAGAGAGAGDNDNDDEENDAAPPDIPFVCLICKSPYTHPIVTKCSHYFCEACALRRFRKTPACAQCGAGTGGVFNAAKGLQGLLDRRAAREAAREADGDGDGQEDEGGDT